jgi:hypothetical protein
MQFQTLESNATTFGTMISSKVSHEQRYNLSSHVSFQKNQTTLYFSQARPALEYVKANQVHFYTHGPADSKHQALRMIIEGICECKSNVHHCLPRIILLLMPTYWCQLPTTIKPIGSCTKVS